MGINKFIGNFTSGGNIINSQEIRQFSTNITCLAVPWSPITATFPLNGNARIMVTLLNTQVINYIYTNTTVAPTIKENISINAGTGAGSYQNFLRLLQKAMSGQTDANIQYFNNLPYMNEYAYSFYYGDNYCPFLNGTSTGVGGPQQALRFAIFIRDASLQKYLVSYYNTNEQTQYSLIPSGSYSAIPNYTYDLIPRNNIPRDIYISDVIFSGPIPQVSIIKSDGTIYEQSYSFSYLSTKYSISYPFDYLLPANYGIRLTQTTYSNAHTVRYNNV